MIGLLMLPIWPVVFMHALSTPAWSPPMSMAAAQWAPSANIEAAVAIASRMAAARGLSVPTDSTIISAATT